MSSSSGSTNNEDEIPMYLMPVAAALGMYAAFAGARIVYLLYAAWTASRAGAPDKPIRSTAAVQEARSSAVPLQSQAFGVLVVSFVFAVITYSFTVARVEGAAMKLEHGRFDPWELLILPADTTNATLIKQAYRRQSLLYHPDKLKATADRAAREAAATTFYRIQAAYRALTDDVGMRNFKQHGHPDGPLQVPAFTLAAPKWLLFPEGKVAAAMLLLYLGFLCFLIYYCVSTMRAAADQAARDKMAASKLPATTNMDHSQSVSVEDLQYLARQLSPDTSHWHALLAVISTPENVLWSTRQAAQAQEQRDARRREIDEEAKASKKSSSSSLKDFDALVNEGGWEDDDDDDDDEHDDDKHDQDDDKDDDENDDDKDNKRSDDDDDDNDKNENNDNEYDPVKARRAAAAKAKKAEEEKKKEMERLQRATGKAAQLMEGIDDGVLGQKWVERTLAAQRPSQFPPADLGCLETQSFEHLGESVAAVDHPGVRRILCMTAGRLNSQMLNSHPELLEAGVKKLIDQTYFRACMEFRQRTGMLLEASLKLAMSLLSFDLVSTLVDVVAMFKIGCQYNAECIQKYEHLVRQQYGCLPRLRVRDPVIVPSSTAKKNDDKEKEKEDSDENKNAATTIATDDDAELSFHMERLHAENFLQQKLAMFKKQGIPPQLGLQSYREGWWCLLRRERLKDHDHNKKRESNDSDDDDDDDDDDEPEEEPLSKLSPVLEQMKIDKEVVWRFESKMNSDRRLITAWPMMVTKIAQKTGKVSMQIRMPAAAGKYRFHVLIKSQDFIGADHSFHVDAVVVDKAATVVNRTNDNKDKDDDDEPPSLEQEKDDNHENDDDHNAKKDDRKEARNSDNGGGNDKDNDDNDEQGEEEEESKKDK